jgi:rubrerythrin
VRGKKTPGASCARIDGCGDRHNTTRGKECAMNRPEIERLFRIAIDRELEANRFYTDLSKKVTDLNIQAIFNDLAAQEMGHYELLEKLRSDPSLEMKFRAPAQDWQIAEAEDEPSLNANMKPRDAIALAMKKEQRAAEFYKAMSAQAGDGETKAIFNNLANMELGHKHQLEEAFIDVGYPEVF